MHLKRTCQFLLDREPGKPDARVRYRIKWDRNRSIISRSTGYRVDVDKWSVDTQRCRANTTHGKKKTPAAIINRELQRLENAVNEIFAHFELRERIPTPEEFRDRYDQALSGTPASAHQPSLFDAWAEFVAKTAALHAWSDKTRIRYKVAGAHLQNYNPALTFDDLSESLLVDFVRYLQSPEAMMRFKSLGRGMKNTTAAKTVEQLREFLRWAKANDRYAGSLHETFRPRFKGVDGNARELVYLTWDELQRLYHFEFKREYLARVRDVFCFLCFTSLRYSDVAKLTRADVKEDHIRVVTKKTADGLKIELNKYSRAILEKYRNETFPRDMALPVISNVKMNAYLKTMGETAGFTEPVRTVYFVGAQRHEEVHPKHALLTTHCGRRTFVVNSLYLGIPAEVVMSWTGHSDYESMRPYIKIVDALKNQSMKKFDEK
ncbi:MAG: site-specific integrase [Tannerella sp.]|jgi:integrase|nr:site-specific integrase [Tannerella sp.]